MLHRDRAASTYDMVNVGWTYKKNAFGQIKKIEIKTEDGLGRPIGDGVTKQELADSILVLRHNLSNMKWKNETKKEAEKDISSMLKMEGDFAILDTDNNGILSREEVFKPTAPGPVITPIKHKDLISAFDAADNGTTTEYRGKKVKRVSINDGGGNNIITRDEVEDRLESLNSSVTLFKKNGSFTGRRFTDIGKETYEKTKALLQSVLDRFSTIDTNNDGKIDKDER